ncbi:MAG TPA: NAD(P)/FAD-dependent oxidoreductase, partial [Polyangiales bacterium]|nr:NAD(P)/FAD-dependent oxidoreductase [Polyangiales bacterium]
GLAAALQLARARRQVLILDSGQRRNRFAAHSHGFLGQDGQPPETIAAKGRAEVLAYPTVSWRDGLATEVSAIAGGFIVRVGSEELRAKRLILATGVVDELPDIPGLAEQWGKRVFFCPYCDGYEFALGRLGILATSPSSGHFAILVSEWAAPGGATLFLNGAYEPDALELARLESRQISIEREPVANFGTHAGSLELRLRDGRTSVVAGVFLHPRAQLNGPFAQQLGLETEMGRLGPYYKTDATKETNVPGVFACGDVALPLPAVAHAVSDGVKAGAFAHQSLVFR